MIRPIRNAGIFIKPLSHALGAEVSGVDLSQQLDPVDIAQIREALNQHLVLVFPGQDISAEAHARFCGSFGTLRKIRPVAHQVPNEPYVRYVSNVSDRARNPVHESGEMQFHADQSYLRSPCIMTTLFAIEIPAIGGNTLFVNCYDAYAALSEDLKRAVVGRKALNMFDIVNIPTLRSSGLEPSKPQWWHPMVRTHAETGREALFVNRMMTCAVQGMRDSEGGALLEKLFAHQEQERFMYEHVWSPGDFLMWDNRSTLHARREFHPGGRRMLRRVTIHADEAG